MLSKAWLPEDVVRQASANLIGMVKAGLPESQSPPGANDHPSEQRLITDDLSCRGMNRRLLHLCEGPIDQ